MWKWLESLVDPIVKKVTKSGSKKTTGKKMSDEEYETVKDKGLSWLENGTTGDKSLDDYLDTNIPNSAKSAIETGEFLGKGLEWGKEQIESFTGDKTNEVNKDIANQNLEFEKEKFEYDKALQQQLFEREDTSYQRTVNDMRLAGLNPLNMQNTNGAGETVATTAPSNDFQHQMNNQLGVMETIFNSAMQAKMTQSNHSLQSAQANLINRQAENQRIKNIYEADILANQVAGLGYDNQNKWFESNNQLRDLLFNQMMGWTKDMPDWMKQSSARMNWKPFNFNMTRQGIETPLSDTLHTYYSVLTGDNKPDISIPSDMSSQLLSDELLTGTLGIFGNILKLLVK